MHVLLWRLVKILSPSLFPITLGDLLSVFVVITLYHDPSISTSLQILHSTSEAVATFFIGKFSDIWSRRQVLILIHIFALFGLGLYMYTDKLIVLMGIGVIFSPGSPARASIIDNYKSIIVKFHENNFYRTFKLTEARLLGISWIFQYLPWVLFPILFRISKTCYIYILGVLILISLIFIYFTFKDELDKKLKTEHQRFFRFYIKSPLTLAALLFSQITFWIPFDSIDYLPNLDILFFLVGFGATFGTILSLLYKRTPHVSVIVNSYGFGFMLSAVTLFYLIFMGKQMPMGLQLVLLSALGGFYLPFVFDILVNNVRVEHRGVMFAYAEVIQSIAAITALITVTFYKDSIIFLFSLTTFFFMLALVFQLKEEKYDYFNK